MSYWKNADIPYTPIEVAQFAQQQLQDVIFFDSSVEKEDSISIIAANAVDMIKLEAFNPNELRQVLGNYAVGKSPSLKSHQAHYPQGGLFGWINYEGNCVFGVYSEVLIYDHAQAKWYENGSLSKILAIKPTLEKFTPPIINQSSQTNLSADDYQSRVKKVQQYITAGDIYQVNLAWKSQLKLQVGTAFDLYKILRGKSSAPMSAWLSLDGKELLSASPELFLKIQGQKIQTHPIKGTRPRSQNEDEDEALAQELLNSEKELSELTMITDLERNDLGQVCKTGSVHVKELHKIEHFEQVHHLISIVQGELKEGLDCLDAVAACIPGGSITGAPKKRAMEIIKELEPDKRGFYTGAIGYIGFNTTQRVAQFNLAIRSIEHDKQKKTLSYYAGSGIVADSNPQAEYQETLHKARGIEKSLNIWMSEFGE